ncbi:MAG: hypothetical protein JWO56_1824 [Acidobacteria bacterium]|nr:hypothetical protein [Acidobacteriota bacterium]
MNRNLAALTLLLLLTAGVANAENLAVGNTLGTTNSSAGGFPGFSTDIDLSSPATASGNVTSVSFRWSAFPCTETVKIKFFRRIGNVLTYLGERGPFNTTGFSNTVAITPFPVRHGDLIGITRLGSCGNAVALVGIVTAGYLSFNADITADVTTADGLPRPGLVAVAGSGPATTSVARVIPAVASTMGAAGSNFKSGVQIFNPAPLGGETLNGALVFHPAGAGARPSDPQLAIIVGPQRSTFIPDVMAAMGQTGLGTIDVVLSKPTPRIVVTTRVYNDGGANGTSGFTEPAFDPSDASGTGSPVLVQGATAFLLAPPDPAAARMNIGIRTLFQAVTATVTTRDSSGTILGTASHSYPPNYFEQVSASAFTGRPSLPGNASIQISVSAGAIIYGATTDNTTNDPSVQFAEAQTVIQ